MAMLAVQVHTVHHSCLHAQASPRDNVGAVLHTWLCCTALEWASPSLELRSTGLLNAPQHLGTANVLDSQASGVRL